MIKFGTDGWRGVIADDFTFDGVRKAAYGTAKFAEEFKVKEIVIGYDRRFLSEEFAKASAEVVAAMGYKVYISDKPVPTPALSVAVVRAKVPCGIMITASHNPYYFNGFKVKGWYGGSAFPEITAKIERFANEVEKVPRISFDEGIKEGKIQFEDFVRPYIEFIRRDVDINVLRKLKCKVVFDPMWGASAGLLSLVLRDTEIEVVEIRGDWNPLFGFSRPEPISETLRPLFEKCIELKVDGFAVDGDGDRIAGSTDEGEIVDSHKCFAIILEHLAKNKGLRGKVYKAFSTSDIVDKVAQLYGLEVITVPVGFKHIAKGMLEEGVLVGGEESGGIGVPHHLMERDGLFCASVILEMRAYEGDKTMAQIIEDIERKVGRHRFVRHDVHVEIEEQKGKFMKMACEVDKLRGLIVEDRETIDGIKMRFKGGGFLMVRPSGTEPLVRLYCETDDYKKSKEIIDEFLKIVRS